MKVTVTVVGQRTEHWTDLFAMLAGRPDVELTVILADVSPTTVEELARHPRITVVHLDHRLGEGRSGHMASVLFARGGADVLRRDPPDVIHIIGEAAYLSTAQVLSWRKRYCPSTPVTLYAAQNVVTRFPLPFPWLERRAYRRVNHALPITPAAVNVLRTKGYAGPVTIVPLGVDTARFRPAPITPDNPAAPEGDAGGAATAGDFTVGFVGRLEPHKGIATLLRAAELADCSVLVVGRGSLTPLLLESQRRRPGKVTHVDWVDHDRLPALLHQMHVLALPSIEVVQRNVLPWVGVPLREQFGRVLVEAMACGVPVVGSDVGEIAHVIGPAGRTCPPGDAVALAGLLRSLDRDRALAERFGRAGLDRAITMFGWDRVADQMVDVWSRLLHRPRRAAHLLTSQ